QVEIALIYVPCGSEEDAARIARQLLNERLIACANIYASRSLYNWKGDLADETEHVLICKTANSRAKAAVKRIEQLHTYEIPCIIRLRPEQVNRAYAAWVLGEVENWKS